MIDVFDSDSSFEEKALAVFGFQRKNNAVYARFCEALNINNVTAPDQIPLLPIQAFKEKEIITGSVLQTGRSEILCFRSSGTAGMRHSRHYVPEPEIYRTSVISGIRRFYDIDDYAVLAYTPGYSENPHSSLIWMLRTLIGLDKTGLSRFRELNTPLLQTEIDSIKNAGKKLMIFGAAFGLLDLLELHPVRLPSDSIVIETGGMKTHRRELSKEELHNTLAEGFGLSKSHIHSEYGMAELLSQAYSRGGEWFENVPWMQISVRNPENPLELMPPGEEGLLGIIDLANLYSCAFILTGDRGVAREDGHFKVMGRWNPHNLRGCNFLIDGD